MRLWVDAFIGLWVVLWLKGNRVRVPNSPAAVCFRGLVGMPVGFFLWADEEKWSEKFSAIGRVSMAKR